MQHKKTILNAIDDKKGADETDAAVKQLGAFAILATEDLEESDLLPLYYTRQQVEQVFDITKNYADLLPIRAESKGHHLSCMTIYHHFKAIAEQIGKPEMRFHDLRHTYATLSLQTGANIKTVSSQLGHATTAFTLDRYGHTTDTMRQDAADRMSAFIQSIAEKNQKHDSFVIKN